MFKSRIREVPKRKELSQSCHARMVGRNPKQSGISSYWIGCIVFYLLVSAVLYMMVKELGLWVALAVTAANYAYTVLAIGTMLRMRGDISERNFIILVIEGFKITSLLKKIGGYSASSKPTDSQRTKKS